MIQPEHIEEELNRWPEQWNGPHAQEDVRILAFIKRAWRTVDQEYVFQDDRRENCLRAFWMLGFELSRDTLLHPNLREVPVAKRGLRIIEEEGPLLFAFYSADDERRFSAACRDIELALRRRGE